MSDSNYGDYEQLCGGLEKVATEFENTLNRFGPLYHRLVHADKPVSDAGWKKFAEACRKNATADATQWEEWRPHPNGRACSYFFGRGSKTNLDEFIRFADSGYALLLELAALQAKGKVPENADIHLPERYREADWDLSNDYFGWLLVLHDTAMGCHTIYLRDHIGFWGHPEIGTKSMEEEARMIEQAIKMWSGSEPDAFPVHPFTESLQHDVFVSSAEAIRIWLNDEEIVPVGKRIEESPLYLPEANSVDEDHAALLSPLAESPSNPPEAGSVHKDDATLLVPEPKSDLPAMPLWDARMRKLWVGDKLIKWLKHPSGNQVAVLQAFESQGWPTTPIDDPVEKVGNIVPQRRLNETVRHLNKHHQNKDVLRFHVGNGAVWWEFVK